VGGTGSEWGQGEEMTQALYAHMNNKKIKKKILPQEGLVEWLKV
jgi:hypothetical protein